VLTIWGGKLTTYRSTAEKVMRRLGSSLPARVAVASTQTLELSPS
jgi:glycerol-3-phosphate dehydrogenase